MAVVLLPHQCFTLSALTSDVAEADARAIVDARFDYCNPQIYGKSDSNL